MCLHYFLVNDRFCAQSLCCVAIDQPTDMAMSVSDFVESKKGDKKPEYITAVIELLAFNDIESLNDLV